MRGKVDVVVVYKIDRLTRALADFAKIVEIFAALGSVWALQAELEAVGIGSKSWTSTSGRCRGDTPFARGALSRRYSKISNLGGGWGGIRTHGGLAPAPVFKTGALNRSATHP